MSMAGKKGRVLWLCGGVQKTRQKLPNAHEGRQPLLSHLTKVTVWSETNGLNSPRQHDLLVCLAWLWRLGGSEAQTPLCSPWGVQAASFPQLPPSLRGCGARTWQKPSQQFGEELGLCCLTFSFLPPAEAKNVPHRLEVSGSVAVGWEQPSEPLSYTLPWISQQITRS